MAIDFGTGGPAFTLRAHHPSGLDALASLDALTIAHAYMDGALDIEGDLLGATRRPGKAALMTEPHLALAADDQAPATPSIPHYRRIMDDFEQLEARCRRYDYFLSNELPGIVEDDAAFLADDLPGIRRRYETDYCPTVDGRRRVAVPETVIAAKVVAYAASFPNLPKDRDLSLCIEALVEFIISLQPSPAVFALTFRKLTKTQKFFPNTAEYNEVHEAAEAVMDRFGHYLQKLPQRHERHADQVRRDQEEAALAIVAQECRRHGRCELCVDAIATLAGVGRTTAQNALRQARELGLVVAQGDAGVLEGHPKAGERERMGSPTFRLNRRLWPSYGVL
jgi:hypothetical protein